MALDQAISADRAERVAPLWQTDDVDRAKRRRAIAAAAAIVSQLSRVPTPVVCMMLSYTGVADHAAFGTTSRTMRRLTMLPASSPVAITVSADTCSGTGSLPPSLLRLRPERLALGSLVRTRERFEAVCGSPTFQSHLQALTFGTDMSWPTTKECIYNGWRPLALLRALRELAITNIATTNLLLIDRYCPGLRRLTCTWLRYLPPPPPSPSSPPSSLGATDVDGDTFPNLQTLTCGGQPRAVERLLARTRSLTALTVLLPPGRSTTRGGRSPVIDTISQCNRRLTTLALHLPRYTVDLGPLAELPHLVTLRFGVPWRDDDSQVSSRALPQLQTLELVERQLIHPFLKSLESLLTAVGPTLGHLRLENVRSTNVAVYKEFAAKRVSERTVVVVVDTADPPPVP